MGIKSDKTFEEIVERLVALVGAPPADHGAKADRREDPAREPGENGAPPSSKTPFDHKKR